MKNIKKLITIPLAIFAFYGITSCTPIKPYSVEFGQGYRCETRVKESRIKFFKDGKLIGEKNKTPQGDETYWFVDNEGNFYEERRHNLKIHPQSDYSGELAEEFMEYVNKKLKEGKEILEGLKEGECLLERLIENKQKKEPRRVGIVPLNKIKEHQTTSLGIERFESDYMYGYSLGLREYLEKHDKQFVIIYRR